MTTPNNAKHKPWNEMSPRERDALVAEKVMGWTRLTCGYEGHDCEWYKEKGDKTYKNKYPPYYTTDIKAAWEVLEKMKSQSIYISIASNLFGYKVDVNVQPGIRFDVACEFAPEAICLAALKAMGVDV